MTARSVANRSLTSKPPTPPVQATPTTLISASASCVGSYDITLGSSTILQLRACLNSTYGPIRISEGCIISERASIGLLGPPPNEMEAQGVILLPGVLIETGASVEGACIGASTIIEAGAKIGKGTVVGAYSKVCAGVQLGEKASVDDYTVVYGSGWGERRKEKEDVGQDGMRKAWVKLQGDTLRRMWTK